MEIEGKLIEIGETASFGANGFRKRDIVIETDEQYVQQIQIQFTQDRCDVLNSYTVGTIVKISYNLKGRAWVNPQGETKYFNTIEGWRINRVGSNMQAPQQNQQSPPTQQGYTGQGSAVDDYNNRQPPAGKEEEHDDLPF